MSNWLNDILQATVVAGRKGKAECKKHHRAEMQKLDLILFAHPVVSSAEDLQIISKAFLL